MQALVTGMKFIGESGYFTCEHCESDSWMELFEDGTFIYSCCQDCDHFTKQYTVDSYFD